MNVGVQLRAVERGMKVIASYPEWKHTPIILGESDPEGCAACQSVQNGYRNGPLYGVSVAEATMRTYELARKYGLTVEGAVTWAFEFEDQPAFAGFRELATNGIDKPVLNVFRMFGMLGSSFANGDEHRETLSNAVWLATKSDGALPLDEVVAHSVVSDPDINAVATRNGGEVEVLIWNYHDADVAAKPVPLMLAIDGLTGTEAVVSEFRMDADHSNAYGAWQKMGSPAQPTPEQAQQLEKAGALEQTVPDHPVSLHGGQLNFVWNLSRQGVMLIRLRMPQQKR